MDRFGRRIFAACAAVVIGAAVAWPAWPQGAGDPAAPNPPAPAPAPATPGQPAPVQGADPFGEEVTLAPKTIVYLKGSATWDSAFETLVDAFKSVQAYVAKEGLKTEGPLMTVYTGMDDTGFQFQAAIPIAEEPKEAPRGDIAIGKSPSGKALKFVHRGSYDSMDATYDAITNFLDERRLEAQDSFVEEYVTDPVTTPEDKLVINILVPLK